MKTRVKNFLRLMLNAPKFVGKRKIFCIGQNKTGTSSLAVALRELGITVPLTCLGEPLIHDWAKRDFRKIFHFCHTGQAFQDIPFSLPYTFQALDMRFPGSKFILTIRDSPEQWYSSLIRFHAKLFGNGKVPDRNSLKRATYRYPGWMYEANRAIFPTPEDDLYNKEIMINHYNFHNQSVMEYFRHRTSDLLVINLAEKGSYAKFCEFIGKSCTREGFPWGGNTQPCAHRSNPHPGGRSVRG